MSTLRGPSLPPGVTGELIGTLTIRFLACSTTDTFAKIQFWGEPTFTCVSPLNDASSATDSHAIEYPLVGSIHAMNSYLLDASPLQVSFLRQTKGCRKRKGTSGSGNRTLNPVLVGSAYIRDVSIHDVFNVDSFGAETRKMSLIRKLKMMRPGSDMNDHKSHVIGEAIFELDFEYFADFGVPLPIASTSATLPLDSSHNRLRSILLANSPLQKVPCVRDKSCARMLNGDTVSEPSDLISIMEKQGLLEELLHLCSDDMTIPTVESASNTCVDPVESWISRIVADANTPPAEEFPCLISAGPNKSSAMRTVGLLKLEISDLTLMVKIANKVKGKILYLQDNSHMFSSDPGTGVNHVEIRLHKQRGESSKVVQAGRRSATMKINPVETNNDVILHRISHKKQMEVNFSNDDSVRRWLEGTLVFSLVCQTSSGRSHPRLPRVAMLASNTNKATPFSRNTSKVLLAKACFRLRDVILSETLSVSLDLNLLAAKTDLFEEVVNTDIAVGTVSINLSLCTGGRLEYSVPSCSTTEFQDRHVADTKVQISVKGPPQNSPSAASPHPISLLLSYFAGTKIEDRFAEPSSAIDKTSPRQGKDLKDFEWGIESEGHLLESNVNEQNELLNPVTATPEWLWVRVTKVFGPVFDDIKEKQGCLTLRMSCACQSIQHDNAPHSSGDSSDQTRFILRSYDDSAVSTSSVCSWQFPLNPNTTLVDDIVVILHLSHCRKTAGHVLGASERCLVGSTKISFRAKSVDTSRTLCNWLLGLVAQSPFDVLDPINNTIIGKIEVAIAYGTKRQVDDLSTTYQSMLTIQRWLIRSRTVNKHNFEGGANNKQLINSEIKPESPKNESHHCSQEFDTIHVAFIEQYDPSRTRESSFSPDSLLEEWSQQTMTASKSGHKNTRSIIGSSVGDLPWDEASINLTSNHRESFQPSCVALKSCTSTKESDNSSVSGQIESSNLERTTCCGCVEIKDCRFHQHHSPIKSHMYLCGSTENEMLRNNISCLKPTKLENSFSRGQKDDIRPTTGIDPPEQVKICVGNFETVAACPSKAHEKSRNKSYHVTGNPNVHIQYPPATNPLQEVLHDENASFVQHTSEVERFSQLESSFDSGHTTVHAEEDEDETTSFRSLTSVLGSLDRINSIILASGEFLQDRSCAEDDKTNLRLSLVEQYDGPDVNNTMHGGDTRSRNIERPDPGRHVEPPEENNVTTPCPGRNPREPPTSGALTDTCERGNSPMSVLANRLVNASTSPSNNIYTDETIINGIGDTQPLGEGKERQSNDVEANSDDEISIKGNNHEPHERSEHEKDAHVEYPDQQPRRQLRERYLATYSANKSEAPIRISSTNSHPCGVLQHRPLGGRHIGVLSPLMNCTDPPRRHTYFPGDRRRARSRKTKIGASEELPLADNIGTLFVDTERLERIFQS
jgi:hypothetical protein